MTDNFNSNNSSSEFKNILENDYLNLNNTIKGIFRRKNIFYLWFGDFFNCCNSYFFK